MTKKVFDYLLKKIEPYKHENSINHNDNNDHKATNIDTDTNIYPLKGKIIFLPINQKSVFIENINCYTSQFLNNL